MTTTDWGLFSSRELKQCVTQDELVHVFDEQNTGSVEIICHNCGGLSHIERVCPSPKKKRSLPYIISILQSKYNKIPSPSKRPPGRGQLPPFRSQPRRFQPALRSSGQRVSAQRPRRRIFLSEEEGDDDGVDGDGDGEQSQSEVMQSVQETEPRQPAAFSDDYLFEQEKASAATEASAPVADQRSLGHPLPLSPTALLLSVAAVIASLTAMALDGIERLRALGGIVVITLMLALLGRTYATVATISVAETEILLPGREQGQISMSKGLLATIDSGATSTAIPKSRASMLKEITDASPDQKIWIANDKGLDIISIGVMDIEAPGYRLTPQPGVAAKFWPQEPCTAIIPSSRTLVVDGLGADTILYSVRGLKRDGVKTFLNDDNSIQRENCLLLSDKIPQENVVWCAARLSLFWHVCLR